MTLGCGGAQEEDAGEGAEECHSPGAVKSGECGEGGEGGKQVREFARVEVDEAAEQNAEAKSRHRRQ